MTDLFIYLIKANIALCLFYLAYRLGLRRLTFYTLNRVFLVSGIVFSSLFPLVDVNDFFSRNETIAAQVVQYVPDFSMLQQAAKPEAFTVWTLLEWVFWTGVIVMAFRLLIQLVSLLVLHWKTEPAKVQEHDVRKMDGNISPFSFFRNIYVNPDMHTEEELEAIVRHEQIHVSQWHSADVMMSEVNNVFYWFNPGAWLMKTAVKENLEFITDRKILRSGVNAKAYQYSLVKVSAAQYASGVANNFNFSHLKNRIKMMNKTKSSRLHLYRYGVLAGVVCGVLLSLNYTKAGTVVNHVVSEMRDALDMQKDTTTPATTAPEKARPVIEKEQQAQDKFIAVKADEFQTTGGEVITLEADAITMQSKSEMLKADGFTASGGNIVLKGRVSGIMLPAGDSFANPRVSLTMRGTTAMTSGKVMEVRSNARPVLTLPGTSSSPSLTFRADTTRQPLVVIDGTVYPPGKSGYPPLSNLDPNTIESITVLKDKSAAAIYGPAGENGVLLITTKKDAYKSQPNKLKEVTVVGYPAEEKKENVLEQVVVVGYGTVAAAKGDKPVKERVVTGPGPRIDSAYVGETVVGGNKGDVLSLFKASGPENSPSLIYPNPTKGIVNIELNVRESSANNSIEVKDMNGKTLSTQSLGGFKGLYKGQADLSRYPAGTYIVKVKVGAAEMTSKLIKQ